MVLGNIFVLEISEKKWWVLSKEEERRRGNGLSAGIGHSHKGMRMTSPSAFKVSPFPYGE